MTKLFINGWLGPWGWIREFKEKTTTFEIVDNPTSADIIFQADTTNYQILEDVDKSDKTVIANVLDLADWHTGKPSPDIDEYVTKFVSRADSVFCISEDVQTKLKSIYNINSIVIPYPSQVSLEDSEFDPVKKKKRVVIFCRLADPGKRVNAAIQAFADSDLRTRGWDLVLCGPEPPTFGKLPGGVFYLHYLGKDQLFEVIKTSALVIQPSIGEGLGLPALEGCLLRTLPIYRDTVPTHKILFEMEQIFHEIYSSACPVFSDDGELRYTLEECSHMFEFEPSVYYSALVRGKYLSRPWIRENAFETITKKLGEVCKKH